MNGVWKVLDGVRYFDGVEEYVGEWDAFDAYLYPATHIEGNVGWALIGCPDDGSEEVLAVWFHGSNSPSWLIWESREIDDDLIDKLSEIVKQASDLIEW